MIPDEGATVGHRILRIHGIVGDLVVEIAFRKGRAAEHLVNLN